MRRRVTLSTRSEQIAMFTISRGLMITMLLLCLTWTTSASPALPPPPPPAPTPPPSLATPHPQPRSISTINRQPAPSHPFFTLFGSTGPALKTPRTGRTQTIQKLGMATMTTMASGAKLLTLMTSIPRRCSSFRAYSQPGTKPWGTLGADKHDEGIHKDATFDGMVRFKQNIQD